MHSRFNALLIRLGVGVGFSGPPLAVAARRDLASRSICFRCIMGPSGLTSYMDLSPLMWEENGPEPSFERHGQRQGNAKPAPAVARDQPGNPPVGPNDASSRRQTGRPA